MSKREPNSWIKALAKYNAGKGDWCIPRKDSPDYYKVKALMKPPKPRRVKVIRQYDEYGRRISPQLPTYTRINRA